MESENELVVCPYNSSHVITATRMPYHLIKCRKSYPFLELAVCPFDANHEVRKPELKHHMLNCPSKILLEREISFEAVRKAINSSDPPVKKGFTDLPRYRDHHTHDDDDDSWDEERRTARNDAPRFFAWTSRTACHSQDSENSSLRRPFSQGMAAIARSPGIVQSVESNLHRTVDFNALLAGRGRARLSLSPERAVSISPGASGQSQFLQTNMLPLTVTRPGVSDIVWTVGRGRALSFKYQ
ncbi:unnamed protein product [Candidula unifasciata]|uniref:CHHC U11-48K-type domain-containing protein n=1 Tax=Candidula unifasciata TaxID=100452 RepID=A0A8S4A6D5_9EUPU|nr:unnamed protein product [Candidula unifasciata]